MPADRAASRTVAHDVHLPAVDAQAGDADVVAPTGTQPKKNTRRVRREEPGSELRRAAAAEYLDAVVDVEIEVGAQIELDMRLDDDNGVLQLEPLQERPCLVVGGNRHERAAAGIPRKIDRGRDPGEILAPAAEVGAQPIARRLKRLLDGVTGVGLGQSVDLDRNASTARPACGRSSAASSS